MVAFKGSIWKTGTKDRKVYIELWNYDDTQKLIDAELSPDQAYNIGQALIAKAIKQGYRPVDHGGQLPERPKDAPE